jgi:hypothetical protein
MGNFIILQEVSPAPPIEVSAAPPPPPIEVASSSGAIALLVTILLGGFLIGIIYIVQRKKDNQNMPKHNNATQGQSYPLLVIAKWVLRITGIIVALVYIIAGVGIVGDIVGNIFDLHHEVRGFVGFLIGLIAGAISGFGFFLLAEVITLFVNMGKNVENLAKNVKSLAEREKE